MSCEQIYQEQDFQEYKSNIESHEINLKEFVDDINFIIQHEHLQTDFIYLLDELKRLNPNMSIETLGVFQSSQESENNCMNEIEIYVYLKFLLLDNEIKDEFIKFTKYIAFSHNLLIPRRDGIKSVDTCLFMKFLYQMMNTDFLTDFMDITDIYGDYIALDTSKINNMSYKNNEYISPSMFLHFIKFSNLYNRLRILYNLIYILSDETDACSAQDDFVLRYKQKCIDKFVIMNNFINCIYPRYYNLDANFKLLPGWSKYKLLDEDEFDAVENIPSDIELKYVVTFYTEDEYEVYPQDFYHISVKVFRSETEKIMCVKSFISLDLLLINHSYNNFSRPILMCLENVFKIKIEELSDTFKSRINNNQNIRQQIFNSYCNQKNKVEKLQKIKKLEESYFQNDSFKLFLQNITCNILINSK